jgi:2-amino-4-hydroxy-6-hydroxymethyldihydropteridine diphosphokinase
VAETKAVRAWMSLGSNIDPAEHIAQALRELAAAFGELVVSPIYESLAVGTTGQNFLNLVVGIHTELGIPELFSCLREIEDRNGRRRNEDKFSPRTLDIDLLTYGDHQLAGPDYSLPRSEITRYAFVLLPLSQVAPDEIHPPTGKTYNELWSSFNDPAQRIWPLDPYPASLKQFANP